jgi:FAD/FMN-containing dehydrogenase
LIDAGLRSQIYLPADQEYQQREDSYWSNSAKIGPACIVLPRSSAEVAEVLEAIVSAGQQFAVRSGGHTNWPGSNNIKDGITIDRKWDVVLSIAFPP